MEQRWRLGRLCMEREGEKKGFECGSVIPDGEVSSVEDPGPVGGSRQGGWGGRPGAGGRTDGHIQAALGLGEGGQGEQVGLHMLAVVVTGLHMV